MQLGWEQITDVYAFKKDCVTVDQIRILLGDELQRKWIEVIEDDEGYRELIVELPKRLPGCLSEESSVGSRRQTAFRDSMDGIVQAERQETFVIMASKRSNASRVTVTLLVLNGVGAVGYLVLGSKWWWAIPEEHGEIPITGQPFVWAVTTVEILLPFAIVDLAWAAFIVVKKHRQDGRLLLLAPVIWLAAIVIDFAHHSEMRPAWSPPAQAASTKVGGAVRSTSHYRDPTV